MPMAKTLSYKEVKSQDISQANPLQQWLETHRQERGIHYKREGKKIYVLISSGERPTGGYKVIIDQAVMESLDTAYISAHITTPKPDTMVTQKITYPYACIEIESDHIKSVQGALID